MKSPKTKKPFVRLGCDSIRRVGGWLGLMDNPLDHCAKPRENSQVLIRDHDEISEKRARQSRMYEIVEESSTYTLRMEEVIPTPPQAIEVKMDVFVTSLILLYL